MLMMMATMKLIVPTLLVMADVLLSWCVLHGPYTLSPNHMSTPPGRSELLPAHSGHEVMKCSHRLHLALGGLPGPQKVDRIMAQNPTKQWPKRLSFYILVGLRYIEETSLVTTSTQYGNLVGSQSLGVRRRSRPLSVEITRPPEASTQRHRP